MATEKQWMEWDAQKKRIKRRKRTREEKKGPTVSKFFFSRGSRAWDDVCSQPLLSRRRGMYCRRVPSRLPSSSSSSSSSTLLLLLLLHFPLASPSSTGKHQGRWPYKVLLERQHNTSENSPKGESGVIVLPSLCCCCCSLFLPLRVFCLFACVHMFSTFLLRQKQFASAQVEGGNTVTNKRERGNIPSAKEESNEWLEKRERETSGKR